MPSSETKKQAEKSLGQDLGEVPDNLDEETIREWQRLSEAQRHKPTPADQWGGPRRQGFVVELPSGRYVRMRRTMNIAKAIREGTIPNPLGARIQKNIEGGSVGLVLPHLEGEELIQAGELIANTVVMAMVEPKVCMPPENENPELWEPPVGSLSIMDVELADRLFICAVAQGGTTDLDKFREQQAVVVEPVPTRERVELPAKRSVGSQKSSSRKTKA